LNNRYEGVNTSELSVSEGYRDRVDDREDGYKAESNPTLSLAYRHLCDNDREILT
jgi:hypothetical protein